jgi:ABC-type oligopeptide transport system substrate-binding subunit
MNMRNSPFDDVRVRKAMAMLFNRRKMNSTIMCNQ